MTLNRCLTLLVALSTVAACTGKGPGLVKDPSLSGADQAIAIGGGNLLVPDSIAVPLPALLTGGNAIAAGGGNAIAAGGGNWRVLAGSPSMAAILKENVAVYRKVTEMVEAIVKQVKQHRLELDRPYTVATADIGEITILVRKVDGRGLISIGRGKTATEQQLIGISYDPETRRGTMVMRPDVTGPEGILACATTFDLNAKRASADAVADRRGAGDMLARVHWEFDGAPTGDRDFRLQIGVAGEKPSEPKANGHYLYTANIAEKVGAAAVFGMVTGHTQQKLIWYPNDGNFLANPIARDFYVDAAGKDMAPADAPAALKALVPGEADLVTPYPAMPNAEALLGEAVFAFPN